METQNEKRLGWGARIALSFAWGAMDTAIASAKNPILKHGLTLAKRIGKDLTDILVGTQEPKSLAVEAYFRENWRGLSAETLELLISIFTTYVPDTFKMKGFVISSLQSIASELK